MSSLSLSHLSLMEALLKRGVIKKTGLLSPHLPINGCCISLGEASHSPTFLIPFNSRYRCQILLKAFLLSSFNTQYGGSISGLTNQKHRGLSHPHPSAHLQGSSKPRRLGTTIPAIAELWLRSLPKGKAVHKKRELKALIRAFVVAQMVKRLLAMRETQV